MVSLTKIKKRIESYKKININSKVSFLSQKDRLTPFRVCVEIVAAVLVGLIIGHGIDKLAGTEVTFKIVCLVLGCIASLRVIYQLALK